MKRILPFALAAIACAGEPPRFRATTAVTGLRMGYQLVVADLNRDRRPDLIVVDERATELAWYENPGWTRHVLIDNVPRVINLECADLDGNGIPEIAMAHHFETNPEKSAGTVLLLRSGADPRGKWTAEEIDRVPTAHRVRWIRLEKKGPPLLLIAPLVGIKSRAPDYADTAPIYAYRPGEWKRITVSNELKGVLHSIAPVQWMRGAAEQLLTASFDGLSRLEPRRNGPWVKHGIAAGSAKPCPECGSSEVKMGHLGKRVFLAAIEPWHGNQVVVYLQGERAVLDDTMINGHALAVGDLDGDGNDEIVAGFRGKGFRLALFRWNGRAWQRDVLDDGGVAAADCKIADFDGDRRPDIACSGASTGNVKIYYGTRADAPRD